MIYQTSDISEVYYGNINIVSGYVGNDLIFPSESPTPPTPTVNEYLNFTAVDGDAVIGMSGSASVNVMYSFDKYTWRNLETPYQHRTVTIPNGRTVYISGNNTNEFSTSVTNYKQFTISGTVEANGNIQSLLYGSNFDNLTIPNDYCFYQLFNNCTGLLTAPQLPATTLADFCYAAMFRDCTSLTSAPQLPATALTKNCYDCMFQGCTSLTSAPILHSTNLARGCYYAMFINCTSLTTAPVLPATTLAETCYDSMFEYCTGLTSAPQLPATTLAEACYSEMFASCKSLTSAPQLPATTLAEACYREMFMECTSLTTAPVLPATTLAEYCYYGMFLGCTSLTTAPVLPALNLVYWCYHLMFDGCSNLNYIKAMFLEIALNSGALGDWTRNVASNGTFVKNINATWDVRGDSGVPNDWTIQYEAPN